MREGVSTRPASSRSGVAPSQTAQGNVEDPEPRAEDLERLRAAEGAKFWSSSFLWALFGSFVGSVNLKVESTGRMSSAIRRLGTSFTFSVGTTLRGVSPAGLKHLSQQRRHSRTFG